MFSIVIKQKQPSTAIRTEESKINVPHVALPDT